jgi:hypothetical protein
MSDRRRRVQLDAVPLHEELEALARHYHHLQNEYKRMPPENSARRRIEEKLHDVRARFDRLLDELVHDEEQRQAWVQHIHNRGPLPDGPPPIHPVLFRGVAEVSGSELEIRNRGPEIEIFVDASMVERRQAKVAPIENRGPAHVRLNSNDFLETFHASDDAIAALAEFRDSNDSPPWEYASELLEDGLVDVHFALTPRGNRATELVG